MKVTLEPKDLDEIYDVEIEYNEGIIILFFRNDYETIGIIPIRYFELDEKSKEEVAANQKFIELVKEEFTKWFGGDPPWFLYCTESEEKDYILRGKNLYKEFYNSLPDELKLLYELQ